MNTVIRYFYAPIFFIGFIGIAIWLVANQINKLWLIPMLVVAIAVSFVCERLLPYERSWNLPKGDSKRDTVHALVNEFFNVIAVSAIPIIAVLFPFHGAWPHQWSLVWQLGLAILIADFGITLMHYFSHKVEFLWRFHAVHHSVERMYGFNGLMKHPAHQAIELIAGTTPLILMGMPLEIGALLAYSVAIQLLLQHSNVDIRLGNLSYFWAIAPGHRHHHLASTSSGDVNFGLFTMLWDHLLGTFVLDRPQPRRGDIGLAGNINYPRTYIAQLRAPFNNRHTAK